jgi:putative FmdB family regulatory protein
MPLFEYRCNGCGRKFALLVGMTAVKAKLVCPKCGSKKATKLISRIAKTPKSEDDFDDLPDDLGGDLGDMGDGDMGGEDLGGDSDDE